MSAARRTSLAGLVLLAGIVGLALLGPLAVGDPARIDVERIFAPPSVADPLGTDALGRSVLARLVHGARPSLLAALIATACAVTIGFGLGAVAGLAGPAGDMLLTRATDVVDAFPPLLGALAILGVSPAGSRLPPGVRIGAIVGLFAWPALFRFVRAEVRRLARSEVAAAARCAGAHPLPLALRHLLPLAAGPALVPAAFLAGGSVMVEAGLGFFGLGVPAPAPSWGNLLHEAYAYPSAWWLALFPGACVFLTVLAFHLLGEGLRASRGA